MGMGSIFRRIQANHQRHVCSPPERVDLAGQSQERLAEIPDIVRENPDDPRVLRQALYMLRRWHGENVPSLILQVLETAREKPEFSEFGSYAVWDLLYRYSRTARNPDDLNENRNIYAAIKTVIDWSSEEDRKPLVYSVIARLSQEHRLGDQLLSDIKDIAKSYPEIARDIAANAYCADHAIIVMNAICESAPVARPAVLERLLQFDVSEAAAAAFDVPGIGVSVRKAIREVFLTAAAADILDVSKTMPGINSLIAIVGDAAAKEKKQDRRGLPTQLHEAIAMQGKGDGPGNFLGVLNRVESALGLSP